MKKIPLSLGIAVNFIWGLAFLFPFLLKNTNPLLIASGRYLVYGALSLSLLWLGKHNRQKLDKRSWAMAALLAFTGNVGYYLALSLAIRFAGITVTALLIGVLPLSIMMVGNWRSREVGFSRLVCPALLILSGLVGINWLEHASVPVADTSRFWCGVVMALAALGLWTGYGITNAAWLKRHTHISPQHWSLVIGVCCLFQSVLVLPWLFDGQRLQAMAGDPWWQILAACLVLGVLVSWLATAWWNQVSRQLPVTLSGQLIVFETIASLIYGHIATRSWPAGLECLFIVLVLTGVLVGIRVFQQHPEPQPADPVG